jgi:hypothetical protein
MACPVCHFALHTQAGVGSKQNDISGTIVHGILLPVFTPAPT